MHNSMSSITFVWETFRNTHYPRGQAEKTIILVFHDFRNNNLICENFNYDIHNQGLKLHKYT